ncbi:hypothetical protein [Protofrankia symbiont of Coriaria ruscifolia]|uniref:hypothetical protein n=1 Tax=Protofrankia symbiont of Coriaria ruscifolia TaxID=1306542 RepID=UPI001041353F|nr:hypothetical protein [Protofrankia symbiont of Coriaria ruscifolia]
MRTTAEDEVGASGLGTVADRAGVPAASTPAGSASRTSSTPSDTPSRRPFPPERLAQAFLFLVVDLPGMLIRDRPDRTAPRTTKRPSPRYPTRKTTDPGTRRVTSTIVLHSLEPETIT